MSATSHWPAPTPKPPLDSQTLHRRAIASFALSLALFVLLITYWIIPTNVRLSPSLPKDHLLMKIVKESTKYARHVLYAAPIFVPVTSWFVIANWVGWQYFRYA